MTDHDEPNNESRLPRPKGMPQLGLKMPNLGKSVADRIFSTRTTDYAADHFAEKVASAQSQISFIDDLDITDSPSHQTAKNTEAAAQAASKQIDLNQRIADLTQANLEQARVSERRATNAENRNRRISWASLAISAAALATAIATLLKPGG